MQPESSGCNEVKYNLNVDTIDAIFKTYPAGKYTGKKISCVECEQRGLFQMKLDKIEYYQIP